MKNGSELLAPHPLSTNTDKRKSEEMNVFQKKKTLPVVNPK